MPESRQQLLHVEQPAGVAVDRVLRAAGAEHGPADRHLGVLDRQRAVGVVDGEQHLGPAQRRAAGGAGEDDVLHLAAAQRLGALLAHHPGERVDHVGLARAVRPDDAGDARLELQGGRGGEGLEPLEGQALQVQRRAPHQRRNWGLERGEAQRGSPYLPRPPPEGTRVRRGRARPAAPRAPAAPSRGGRCGPSARSARRSRRTRRRRRRSRCRGSRAGTGGRRPSRPPRAP